MSIKRLVAVVVLACAGLTASALHASAAVTLVQKTSQTSASGSALAATLPSPVQAGNLITVSVSSWSAAPTATAIKDSLGNAYALAGAVKKTGAGGSTALFYAKNVKGGTDTITFTLGSAGNEMSLVVAEFSGIDQVNPLDAALGASGSSNTPSSGAMTPTAAGDVLIGASTHDNTLTTTAGAGSTMIAVATEDAGSHQPLAMEYAVLGGTAATSTTFKLSASNSWAVSGALFKAAGGVPDTTPPTVSLTSPANGATVSSTITIAATATDNVGVVSVQFQLDGANLGAAVTTAPYQLSWNTTTATNGAHTLTAVAKDAAGNSATSSVSVTAANPPVISAVTASSITTSGAAIAWTTNIPSTSQVDFGTTIAYGSSTVADGTLVTSHSAALAGLTPSTLYHYRANSVDANGNKVSSGDFIFTTQTLPDTTPPTVSLTSPANGATVSSTITIAATATDNVGVVSVQFQLDGANLGAAVTTAPYQLSWNTTTATNGAHTLTAVAKDAAGNSATSSVVTVAVNNVVTAPAAIKLVQQVSKTVPSAASLAAALPSAVQAGNFIAVSVSSWSSPATGASITDSLGNIYALAAPVVQTGSGASTALYYAKNVKGGADTITFTGSAGNELSLVVAEFSGIDQANPLDSGKSAIGSSATPAAGSMIPATAGELALGGGTHDNTTVTSAGSGFTMIAVATEDAGSHQPLAMEYAVQSGVAAVSPSFSIASASTWGQAGALFKAAPTGPDTIAPTVPTNLAATPVSATGIALSWTPSTDNIAVAGYRISRDGTQIATSTAASFSDSGLIASSTYTYTVSAFDAAGNISAESAPAVATTPVLDVTPPTVALTAPLGGTTVGGIVTLAANASDNVAIANVQFAVDGVNVGGPLAAAPYTMQWNSVTTANGTHAIAAVATDGSGNSASSSVTVTVLNTTQTPTWNTLVNIGQGYVDSHSRQVVRTPGGTVYVVANASALTANGPSSVRIYKGAPVGTPSSFAEVDAAHRPADAVRIGGVEAKMTTNSSLIHVVYELTGVQKVMYQTFDTNTDTWGAAEQIGTIVGQTNQRYLGKIGLALDANGIPHATFGGISQGMFYTNRIGGAWSSPVQFTTDNDQRHPSLAFDTNGVLRIAFYNSCCTQMLYRERNVDGTWTPIETIPYAGIPIDTSDQSPSLVIDATGRSLVGLMGAGDAYKLFRRTGPNVWQDVSPSTQVAGHSPGLYINNDNLYAFEGHDEFAFQPSVEVQSPQGVWGTYSILSTSPPARDGSASLRWDLLWPGSQNDIDGVFMDESAGTYGEAYYLHGTP